MLARLALLVLAVQISGCALPAREKAGALRAEVVARLGPPTASFPLPSGERLLYSELPAGFAAYNLDFDASGRLVRNEQVLTQARFENLPVGIWTTADVQRTFGAPLRVERVARFEGDIWTYRFRQNSDPRLAHVHLDRQGVVRLVMFTDELPHFDNARD
ncbi:MULTISPECIES: hypothetical protein [Acidovorax]|uniref:Lipoprotein transmembrane n=1 Tax=Acidovorax facilis TaxID=12917 RepID=A0ABV8D9S4_9BURK|nr:hypothetical protein [Acidovorax sp. SD340]MCO4242046.1 hypothetical protein [Acidovorax facilis]OGB17459.1 MAG: hypothetical protein A3E23_10280 [Burkholderiales bacterium RIFCSPHIGHO2_12_FULL_65_48]OGB56779.1 MAG: hypothetical protein A3F71_16510 [Burkholderiales bacterium RIFCSPLOWO2_12_FULL_64_33]KQB57201.1 hypothetical protein AE621_22150 [Acidovorax sp. SD340]MBO1007645.1 hypothetical protein [Acidovorax sp. SD340]